MKWRIRPFWKKEEDEDEETRDAHDVQYGFEGENGRGAPGNMGVTGDSSNLEATQDLTDIRVILEPMKTPSMAIENPMPMTTMNMESATTINQTKESEQGIEQGANTETGETEDGIEEEQPKTYGPQQLVALTSEMSQALVLIKSGRINDVPQEVMEELDKLAESSTGMAATLGMLTDQKWDEFAYRTSAGNIALKNNRTPDMILQDNYYILGSTLSKYAMKLNDPDFPPELYDDAVGALLTIVKKAEKAAGAEYEDESLAEFLPNRYEAYYEKHKDSRDILALEDAFDYEDELIQMRLEKDRGKIQAGAEEYAAAALRCREGKGTAEDYALVHAFAPDLTKEEMYEDESYIELLQEIKTGRSNANRPYDPENPDAEKEWYDTQALRYITEKGYDCDLNSIVGMQVKDMLMDFKLSALNQMKETAAKLGYETIGEYMKKTGVTMETIDEIAKYDLRWFEENVANEETVKNVRDFVYQGDGSVNNIGVAVLGGITGVGDYFSERVEAFYNWAESMNVSADAAKVRALYTGEYGRFSGERELYNELMRMCEENYFPSDEMNAFVKQYLEEGGSPFDLGIVPGELGWVTTVDKAVSFVPDTVREWSKENMTAEQGALFEGAASVTNYLTGVAVEKGVSKAIPNMPGYGQMMDDGAEAIRRIGQKVDQLPNSVSEKLKPVLNGIEYMWDNDFIGKAGALRIAHGPGAFNSGFESGLKDGYGFEKSNILANWNYATMMLSSFDYPTKAALEFGVKNMPENQTMGYIDAVANASAESMKDTASSIRGMIGSTKEKSFDIESEKIRRIIDSGVQTFSKGVNEAVKHTMPFIQDAGKSIISEGKGKLVEKATDIGVKSLLGMPSIIPKNSEAVEIAEEKTEALRPMFGKMLENDNPARQLMEIGKRLRMLGIM